MKRAISIDPRAARLGAIAAYDHDCEAVGVEHSEPETIRLEYHDPKMPSAESYPDGSRSARRSRRAQWKGKKARKLFRV